MTDKDDTNKKEQDELFEAGEEEKNETEESAEVQEGDDEGSGDDGDVINPLELSANDSERDIVKEIHQVFHKNPPKHH